MEKRRGTHWLRKDAGGARLHRLYVCRRGSGGDGGPSAGQHALGRRVRLAAVKLDGAVADDNGGRVGAEIDVERQW